MKLFLDWSAYRDAGMGDAYADIPKRGENFARAVSVCINSRQCENSDRGVMCPSFRVTGKAALSPGGRVRLLKAALNGGLGEIPFEDNNLFSAMDLCIACKACKRECENEVDMAMIKIEYLAQRLHTRRPDLRSRLLANLSKNLHFYSGMRFLPGLRNRIPGLAKLGEVVFGLSAKRKLPEPAKYSFSRLSGNKNSELNQIDSGRKVVGEVVLLVDTFTNNFRPENARAAIRVLNRAGYRVFTPEPAAGSNWTSQPLCCGRTQLAHGHVEEAKQNARRMIEALLPHVEAGRPLIGLEPACLLAIRDDYRYLGLGNEASKIASHALLFEEFIARENQAKRFNLDFKKDAINEPVLVHGHCHQKAVGAMKSMRKVLKMIPGLEFQFIDAGCCGMAGSFGLEKEHSDIAMRMAEQALLPTLRDNPHARVISNGFSCQHQIAEGVNRTASHLALLLDEVLAT